MEIRRIAVYSIAHLTEETVIRLDQLQTIDLPFVGGPYGKYGWFSYAHDENIGIGSDSIPSDLFNLMIHARQHGCDNILIDRDAEIVDGLPTYDW